jgi:hypothetical protein
MLSYNYCSITFQQFFQYKPFNNTRNGAKLKTHNKHPRINSFTTFLKKQLNQKVSHEMAKILAKRMPE